MHPTRIERIVRRHPVAGGFVATVGLVAAIWFVFGLATSRVGSGAVAVTLGSIRLMAVFLAALTLWSAGHRRFGRGFSLGFGGACAAMAVAAIVVSRAV